MALLMETRLLLRKAATRIKHPATGLALQNFDSTYSVQLGPLWPSVRAALLSERKYGALLNNYGHDDVQAELQAKGSKISPPCLEQDPEVAGEEESSRVSVNKSDLDAQQLPALQLSPNIKCLGTSHDSSLLASVLPCLALNVQEGHNVLDLCAAPGGKTLALLQTKSIVLPSAVINPPSAAFKGFFGVNDASVSRTTRLRKVLHSYVPKLLLSGEKLRITTFDGTKHSLMEDDNNIFSKNRTGERRRLPQLQLDLLLAGIEAACPGGEILYSTCTLSQIQNLSVVVDLRPLTHMFRKTFDFAPDLPLGEMVVPHLAANFGPIYMCKLRRLT
ncbi:hypothetical protein F7725_011693 [Dissostichus mawsoni]|uniref:5-cytosine rRNA methyltransferase NSUN4 n=1 Tax=Dissostichus mawsoni TaxID=36200 RepID=A0A7J5Z9K5_DISMA|nr:hypothetical protein F7725_011693 [Dissostichus mawsoni]